MTWKHLLFVALGGAIGSVLRFVFSTIIQSKTNSIFSIPWGTWSVNVVGGFVIGLVMGFVAKHNDFSDYWRLFLVSGICGGFTTFSAFTNESYLLLKQNNYSSFFIYIIISIVAGLLATAAGYIITK
jgi:CrcB protein